MRIWLKPDIMAQYKLIPSDVTAALEKQNLESATGAFGENHENAYEYTIKWSGRLSTPEQFGQIVIRSLPNGDILCRRYRPRGEGVSSTPIVPLPTVTPDVSVKHTRARGRTLRRWWRISMPLSQS